MPRKTNKPVTENVTPNTTPDEGTSVLDANAVVNVAILPIKSASELSLNARWLSERLNSLLYRIHSEQFTENEINKLRTQIETQVTIR